LRSSGEVARSAAARAAAKSPALPVPVTRRYGVKSGCETRELLKKFCGVCRFKRLAFDQRVEASTADASCRVTKRLKNTGAPSTWTQPAATKEQPMKFACLGYSDEKLWDAMTHEARESLIEECFAYDDLLRRGGHWTGVGEALQISRAAKTLRSKGGKVIVTDGPYAETKEQIGGFGLIEARDIQHAIELMSKHPGLRLGPFEIRPIDGDLTERCQPEADVAATPSSEGAKYVCLDYGYEDAWDAMSGSEREGMIEECMAYDAVLRRYGRPLGGVALQGTSTAKTLRSKGGKVLVTDGPFAETKEQLGGVAIHRFRDMNQAIEAWSTHPCLEIGDALEIRPADEEFNARIAAREALVARRR
jgi:hypothetical protein